MEIKEIPNKESSYQVLMEGQCEVVAKNEKSGANLNITELLRDLYLKVYKINETIQTTQTAQSTQTMY